MTPLMVQDVMTHDIKTSVEHIQSDLAARISFEQSYLHDILEWIGQEQKSLFNTFINILWGKDTAGRDSNDLLTPFDFRNTDDITPTERVPGRTAVDALDPSWLANGNLFLDLKRCAENDNVLFFVRYDKDVLGKEELERFVDSVVKEVERCVHMLAESP
ncbi:hypothetical protein ACLMJK_002835 [Lecanora helva]